MINDKIWDDEVSIVCASLFGHVSFQQGVIWAGTFEQLFFGQQHLGSDIWAATFEQFTETVRFSKESLGKSVRTVCLRYCYLLVCVMDDEHWQSYLFPAGNSLKVGIIFKYKMFCLVLSDRSRFSILSLFHISTSILQASAFNHRRSAQVIPHYSFRLPHS